MQCLFLLVQFSVGGGVHPGMAERYMNDLGNDIILAPGGPIQGRPMGATVGARAMRQAIDAVMSSGTALTEAAQDHEELRVALERFAYHNTDISSHKGK